MFALDCPCPALMEQYINNNNNFRRCLDWLTLNLQKREYKLLKQEQ